MRRTIIGLLFAVFTATAAQAVTLKDIVDLTRAGLGEDVLLALIEVDGGVFDVDAATLARLKAAGVSDKVIVALVRSGRTRPASPEPQALADFVSQQQAQEPDPIYPQAASAQPAPPTIVREVAVPYPVYVAVPVIRGRHESRPSRRAGVEPSITPPLLTGGQHYLTDVPPPPPPAQPVYWGSSGKLRPDAWKPQ